LLHQKQLIETRKYKEVKCTEPSPSVRLPCPFSHTNHTLTHSLSLSLFFSLSIYYTFLQLFLPHLITLYLPFSLFPPCVSPTLSQHLFVSFSLSQSLSLPISITISPSLNFFSKSVYLYLPLYPFKRNLSKPFLTIIS